MNATTVEILLARTISLRGVRAYLHANGWVRDDSSRRESSDIHLRLEDDREAAVIPAFEDSADCGTRIYQVAEQMARVEGKRRQAVLTDLAVVESDLVRLPNAHADNPAGPPDGVAELEAARNLPQAACSADRPQRRYRAGRNKLARRFLNRLRLGHIEPGSYVFNLLLPAAPAPAAQGTLFPLEDPRGRRVAKPRVRIAGVQAGGGPVQPGAADFREFEIRLCDSPRWERISPTAALPTATAPTPGSASFNTSSATLTACVSPSLTIPRGPARGMRPTA